MNKKLPQPPKWISAFLHRVCKPELLEEIEGDLLEYYELWVIEYGRAKANRMYCWHAIKFLRPYAIKKSKSKHSNQYGMYRNYFKVGLRNILKYKTFSFINIFGLAVAMTVGLLVIQMLYNQSTYDRFHKHKERVYRVLSKQEKSTLANARSPVPLGKTIKEEYPIVAEYVQLFEALGGDAVNVEREKHTELRGYFTDDKFFQFFDFELVEGDKRTALKNPNSLIITPEKAYALFGNQSPLGQTVHFSDRGLDKLDFGMGTESTNAAEDWGIFKITGVIDLKKYPTHFSFDVLASSSTLPGLYEKDLQPNYTDSWKQYNGCYTYLLLNETSNGSELQAVVDEIVIREYAQFEDLSELSLPVQALTDITPGRFLGGTMSMRLPIEAYYFLGFLTFIILFSAVLNYTNLSIARALTRAKEIGVRKVNGATRNSIVIQFLAEATITSFFSLVMATVLLYFLKEALSGLWVSRLIEIDVQTSLLVYPIFFVFSLFVGLIAGLYPAFKFSSFSPVVALKELKQASQRKFGMKQVLNTSQFVFSLIFIVSSILVTRQFQHYRDFEYGFDSDNIINISIQGNDYEILSNEFRTIPGIKEVSACELLLSLPNVRSAGIRKSKDGEQFTTVYHIVDHNFLDNLSIELIYGENFRASSGQSRDMIIDETMSKKLGYENPIEALGQTALMNEDQESHKIIGVVRNFEFLTPVDDKNGSVVFFNRPDQFGYLNVRTDGSDLTQRIAQLEEKWREIDMVHPFKAHVFNDQLVVANLWMSDLASIIGFISILAIIISCLGLLGMAVYNTERRAKEVGIRKVLGASVANLAFLLSWSFVKTLLVAILIAAPASYFINNLWLENLPNRVEFGLGTLLMGSGILLVLGLLTIGSQISKMSNQNPVDSLKDE